MEKIAEIYQPLFDLMSKEHGLILTISEMDEILNTASRVITNYGKSFEKKA